MTRNDLVAVLPYDPRWRFAFARERDRLRTALGRIALAIEHVGSTAVPWLAAKPVIDVAVALRSIDDAPAAVAAMAPLGYAHLPQASTPTRWFCLRRSGGARAQHLHLVVMGSMEWLALLGFRDRLRRLPGEARAYARLKRRLAARHRRDRAAYVAAKTPFITARTA